MGFVSNLNVSPADKAHSHWASSGLGSQELRNSACIGYRCCDLCASALQEDMRGDRDVGGIATRGIEARHFSEGHLSSVPGSKSNPHMPSPSSVRSKVVWHKRQRAQGLRVALYCSCSQCITERRSCQWQINSRHVCSTILQLQRYKLVSSHLLSGDLMLLQRYRWVD